MLLRWNGKSLEATDLQSAALFPTTITTAQEAYAAVAWLRRCVDLRAGAVEAMPFTVLRNGENAHWPWPAIQERTIAALLGLTERALCLHGAAYWFKVQNRRGGLLGLRWLAPQTIRVLTDPAQGLIGFERTIGAQTMTLSTGDLLYFWEDNWLGEIGPGKPVAEAALRAARLALWAQDYVSAFFERGGIPPIIISADVLPQERERLETWWTALGKRAHSFWRAVVLGSEAKILQLSTPTGRELALPELLEETRKQIAVAFGVPQTLLEDAANYATAVEHRRSFYAETVVPRCQMLAQVLNEQLLGPLGLELRFQPERLEIFQQEEIEKAQALVVLVQAGIATPDEARAQLGLPVRELTAPASATADETRTVAPELLADLNRWRRKCRDRDGLAEFTSAAIPPELTEAIKTIGGLRGWETAFAFLPRLRAYAVKREPDRTYEDKLRRIIQAVLSARLDAVIEAMETGGDAVGVLNELPAELRAVIQPVLVDAVISEVLAQMALVGLYADVAVVNDAALLWAQQYSYELVSGLTDTTREIVRHAVAEIIRTPGMTNADIRQMLEPAFGSVRAEMIAITEVTRAYAQATTIYQKLLGEFGLEMARVWRTSNDERVCPVCGPNDDKPEWEWTHPDGPPAHPRCRCWTTLDQRRRPKR